jgi:hypothetical protein
VERHEEAERARRGHRSKHGRRRGGAVGSQFFLAPPSSCGSSQRKIRASSHCETPYLAGLQEAVEGAKVGALPKRLLMLQLFILRAPRARLVPCYGWQSQNLAAARYSQLPKGSVTQASKTAAPMWLGSMALPYLRCQATIGGSWFEFFLL